MNLSQALTRYFCGADPFPQYGLEKVSERLDWRIPPAIPFGIELRSETSGGRAEELRYKLNDVWVNTPQNRPEITHWIVKSWGRIKRIDDDTLATYTKRAEVHRNFTPHDRIASFSKVLSVSDPDRYAIFDARVVVSLIAIQLLGEVKDGIAFPYLPGRNQTTGARSETSGKIGFSSMSEYQTPRLESDYGWTKVLPDFAYDAYIECLTSVRRQVSTDFSLTWYEMCLFADAESLVAQVLHRKTQQA